METSIPKSIASVMEVPAHLRALYHIGADGYYSLTAGGLHLRAVRDTQIQQREHYRDLLPPHEVFQRALSKRKLPPISLRDWTTTLGAATQLERSTLLRLLSDNQIQIER